MLPMSINQQKHFTSFYARHLQRIYNWHSTSTTLSLSLSPYFWWWLFLFSFSWNCFNKIYFPLCFACAHAFDHSSVPASISHFKHLFVNYFCLVIRPSRTNDCIRALHSPLHSSDVLCPLQLVHYVYTVRCDIPTFYYFINKQKSTRRLHDTRIAIKNGRMLRAFVLADNGDGVHFSLSKLKHICISLNSSVCSVYGITVAVAQPILYSRLATGHRRLQNYNFVQTILCHMDKTLTDY